jgi:hypothetical protein
VSVQLGVGDEHVTGGKKGEKRGVRSGMTGRKRGLSEAGGRYREVDMECGMV